MSAARHVVGDCEYRVATREEEPVVRDILARVATEGRMRLSFRREPDALAALGALAQDFIVARQRSSGDYIGVCERVVRECFVDGEIRRLAYLGGLRVLPQYRHKLRLLRGGYEAVRQLLDWSGTLPFAFTSIMADNLDAQRVLGANLAGMPSYLPLGEYATFAFTTGGRVTGVDPASVDDLPALASLLLSEGARRQFGGAWTLPTLRQCHDAGWLRAEDFLVIRERGGLRACAAVWDLSAHRQLVVEGYSGWLGRLRPWVNLLSGPLRLPSLPAAGERLRCAYVCPVAAPAGGDIDALLAAARAEARRRHIDVLFAGENAAHPRAARWRAMRGAREYRSRIYSVSWPGDRPPALDPALPVSPELALL